MGKAQRQLPSLKRAVTVEFEQIDNELTLIFLALYLKVSQMVVSLTNGCVLRVRFHSI